MSAVMPLNSPMREQSFLTIWELWREPATRMLYVVQRARNHSAFENVAQKKPSIP